MPHKLRSNKMKSSVSIRKLCHAIFHWLLQVFIRNPPVLLQSISTDQEVKAFDTLLSLIPTRMPWNPVTVGEIPCNGQYVVPPEIFNVDLLISPGVGMDVPLDIAFLQHGIKTILIDTVKLPKSLYSYRNNLQYISKFLGSQSAETRSPEIVISINTLLKTNKFKRVALQMDIEGHEWAIILEDGENMLDSFDYLIIELHGLSALFAYSTFPLMTSAIDILRKYFVPYYTSINPANGYSKIKGKLIPELIEVTLVNKSCVSANMFSPLPYVFKYDALGIGESLQTLLDRH